MDFVILPTRAMRLGMAEGLVTAAAMAGAGVAAWLTGVGSEEVMVGAAGTAEDSDGALFTQQGAPDTPLRGEPDTARPTGLTP